MGRRCTASTPSTGTKREPSQGPGDGDARVCAVRVSEGAAASRGPNDVSDGRRRRRPCIACIHLLCATQLEHSSQQRASIAFRGAHFLHRMCVTLHNDAQLQRPHAKRHENYEMHPYVLERQRTGRAETRRSNTTRQEKRRQNKAARRNELDGGRVVVRGRVREVGS